MRSDGYGVQRARRVHCKCMRVGIPCAMRVTCGRKYGCNIPFVLEESTAIIERSLYRITVLYTYIRPRMRSLLPGGSVH